MKCLPSVVLWLGVLPLICPHPSRAAELAVTMDDFDVTEQTLLSAKERNVRILATLAKHQAKGALFVRGKYVEEKNARALLQEWGSAGHLIGNHTYSHRHFGAKQALEDEQEDIRRCEKIIGEIPGFEKIFRYPYLAEGDTAEKRDALRSWLKGQGYRQGAVTIDASDWYIDERMRSKLKAEPGFDLNRYRDYYLAHLWDRAAYYDGLARRVLGREVRHTLLVHFNLLNALFLEDVLTMFEKRGWKVIDARQAFQDPVFLKYPATLPSGQSLIWGLAKESKKYDNELRYPGEDGVYEKAKMEALGL